jgi:hypothetical protein
MENLQAFVSDPFFAEDDKQMIIYFSSEETGEQGNHPTLSWLLMKNY